MTTSFVPASNMVNIARELKDISVETVYDGSDDDDVRVPGLPGVVIPRPFSPQLMRLPCMCHGVMNATNALFEISGSGWLGFYNLAKFGLSKLPKSFLSQVKHHPGNPDELTLQPLYTQRFVGYVLPPLGSIAPVFMRFSFGALILWARCVCGQSYGKFFRFAAWRTA